MSYIGDVFVYYPVDAALSIPFPIAVFRAGGHNQAMGEGADQRNAWFPGLLGCQEDALAAKDIREFTQNVSWKGFSGDRVLQNAVMRLGVAHK